jgi:restriction system protein
MPIPDYQTLMLPVLRFAGDGREHSRRETIEALAQEFNLSEDERRESLPSGKQPVFDNRVDWARTYLRKARLLDTTRNGHTVTTDRSRQALKETPKSN